MVAECYLTDLIDRVKKDKVFVTGKSTKVLVNVILRSFRAMMNDIRQADKMIRDLENLQSTKD